MLLRCTAAIFLALAIAAVAEKPSVISLQHDSGARIETDKQDIKDKLADAQNRAEPYSFQCEVCRRLMRSVLSKPLGLDRGVADAPATISGQDEKNALSSQELLMSEADLDADEATAAQDLLVALRANAPQLCANLRRTPTMAVATWDKELMEGACQAFIAEGGDKIASALSPYAVCKRMGHCGTAEERTAARETTYNMGLLPKIMRKAVQKARVYAPAKREKVEWLPLVEDIKPLEGPKLGGPMLTVTGKGFVKDKSKCLFARIASPKTIVVSDTVIHCEIPSSAKVGEVDVQIYGPSQIPNENHLSHGSDEGNKHCIFKYT